MHGKPFTTGSTLNGHFRDVKIVDQAIAKATTWLEQQTWGSDAPQEKCARAGGPRWATDGYWEPGRIGAPARWCAAAAVPLPSLAELSGISQKNSHQKTPQITSGTSKINRE